IGQRARHDHAHGVIEIAAAHLLIDVDWANNSDFVHWQYLRCGVEPTAPYSFRQDDLSESSVGRLRRRDGVHNQGIYLIKFEHPSPIPFTIYNNAIILE